MKVVLLIGGEAEIACGLGPKCLTLSIGSVSLIEYHVRTLRLLGIKSSEIIVITGQFGDWRDQSKNNLLRDLGLTEVSLPTDGKRSFSSLLSVLSDISCDLLVLNGNRYFELDEIEQLLSEKTRSAALVDKENHIALEQQVVNVKGGLISNVIKQTETQQLPWFSYRGAMVLRSPDIKVLVQLRGRYDYLSYLEVAVNIANIDVAAIYPQKSLDSAHQINKTSLELTGGSFAGLSRSLVVRKSADHMGLEKLRNEITWLKNLDRRYINKFPEVLDYCITDEEAWYTMPWYQYENLRKKIITGKITLEEFNFAIRKVLDYLWENFYNKKLGDPGVDWVDKKHFDRFFERLNLISEIKPLNSMLALKEILIDGVVYRNLLEIVVKVKQYSDKYSCFAPKKLVMVHGDLHFQNILVSDDYSDFILADPRGELGGSDLFYDLGKLWHSFNGKYDLIHTDIAQLNLKVEQKNPEYIIDFGPLYLTKVYDQISIDVATILKCYPVAQEQDWLLKILFNEFMHFSSLMCFHLSRDEIENRSTILYLQAIKLGDKLLKELREKYD